MEEHEYQAMYDVEKTHWWFVSRRMFIATILNSIFVRYAGKRKIADIGAGTGGMESFLRQYGNVFGIEPNTHGRLLAKRRGVRLLHGTAERTGLKKGSIDIVCFFDVLYHQGINDEKALREAYRVLRPGGWLIITDCAFPFLFGPNDRAVSGRERYVLSQLVAKVVSSGFAVRKKTYTFFVLFPLIAFKRFTDRVLFHGAKHHSDVGEIGNMANGVCVGICRMEALLLPFISYPWGSSLCILARKNGVIPNAQKLGR